MRWSMCSEELCFFNPAVGAFMGAGRVLPVKRGGSVFQKVLVDYQQAMDRGEWAHIFPEGRVWQEARCTPPPVAVACRVPMTRLMQRAHDVQLRALAMIRVARLTEMSKGDGARTRAAVAGPTPVRRPLCGGRGRGVTTPTAYRSPEPLQTPACCVCRTGAHEVGDRQGNCERREDSSGAAVLPPGHGRG